MMSDQVDSMSDAELQTELAKHGFPKIPITASTRKLLVKRLQLALGNKIKRRHCVEVKVKNRWEEFAMANQVSIDSLSDAQLGKKMSEQGIHVNVVVDIKAKIGNSVDNNIESKQREFAMPDQIDSMSDTELQSKLAEHGFPKIPITQNTRKLLVKKLKQVLENKLQSRNRIDNKNEKGTKPRGIRKRVPAASGPSGRKQTTRTRKRNKFPQ